MITIIFTSMTNQSQLGIITWLKKPIAQQRPSAYAASRACVDALIAKKKEKRTEKRQIARVPLHLAWFELQLLQFS